MMQRTHLLLEAEWRHATSLSCQVRKVCVVCGENVQIRWYAESGTHRHDLTHYLCSSHVQELLCLASFGCGTSACLHFHRHAAAVVFPAAVAALVRPCCRYMRGCTPTIRTREATERRNRSPAPQPHAQRRPERVRPAPGCSRQLHRQRFAARAAEKPCLRARPCPWLGPAWAAWRTVGVCGVYMFCFRVRRYVRRAWCAVCAFDEGHQGGLKVNWRLLPNGDEDHRVRHQYPMLARAPDYSPVRCICAR